MSPAILLLVGFFHSLEGRSAFEVLHRLCGHRQQDAVLVREADLALRMPDVWEADFQNGEAAATYLRQASSVATNGRPNEQVLAYLAGCSAAAFVEGVRSLGIRCHPDADPLHGSILRQAIDGEIGVGEVGPFSEGSGLYSPIQDRIRTKTATNAVTAAKVPPHSDNGAGVGRTP